MPTNPLQSIPSPFKGFAFNQLQVLEIIFALVFFVWAIYTLVIIYHWIRYGNRSIIAIPAIILHLLISLALFVLAASAFA